jgi:hypothetical protein
MEIYFLLVVYVLAISDVVFSEVGFRSINPLLRLEVSEATKDIPNQKFGVMTESGV